MLDENDQLLGQGMLRPHNKVAGFGKGVVYAREKNDDDELLMHRYPLPVFRP